MPYLLYCVVNQSSPQCSPVFKSSGKCILIVITMIKNTQNVFLQAEQAPGTNTDLPWWNISQEQSSFEFSKALPDGDPQEASMAWEVHFYKMEPRFSRSSLPKTSTTVTLANCHTNQKNETTSLLSPATAQVLVPEQRARTLPVHSMPSPCLLC